MCKDRTGLTNAVKPQRAREYSWTLAGQGCEASQQQRTSSFFSPSDTIILSRECTPRSFSPLLASPGSSHMHVASLSSNSSITRPGGCTVPTLISPESSPPQLRRSASSHSFPAPTENHRSLQFLQHHPTNMPLPQTPTAHSMNYTQLPISNFHSLQSQIRPLSSPKWNLLLLLLLPPDLFSA